MSRVRSKRDAKKRQRLLQRKLRMLLESRLRKNESSEKNKRIQNQCNGGMQCHRLCRWRNSLTVALKHWPN